MNRIFGNRLRLRSAVVLLVIILLGPLFGPMALADDTDVPVTVIKISAGDGNTPDVLLGEVQDWLAELGYYSGDHTMVFDAETQYSLYRFSKENGLAFSYEGVTEEQWNLLRNGGGKSIVQAVYEDIPYGAYGEDVLLMQMRLKALGYYTDDVVMIPSSFDEGTQAALDLFCETNHIERQGNGASADVQTILFSESANAYAVPEVKQSAAQKFTAYMMGSSSVFGLRVPMFFLWICSVIIGVLTVILFIYFFIPGKEKAARNRQMSSQEIPKYWRKSISNNSGVGLVAMEKLSATGNLLDFQVQYNGEVKNVQCVCKPSVTIGRTKSAIRLDPGDTSISHSHFDLYYRGAVLMLRDHSSNGTYVNGTLIHKSECRIHPGDKIRIGSHVLTIQF